jgi:hypothetical protein
LSNVVAKKEFNLKIIKGQIESEIRNAYYGGITAVHQNSIQSGFFYDVNSSYPASMLKTMPVGNPTYTTNKNLKELFGFVKAIVVAPSSQELANAVLPARTKTGLELFRDTRIGRWFSEELKFAESLGYKITVIDAYIFKKGYNVFAGFINTLYAMKSQNDLNPSRRQTAKLLLVSLYGRLGMRDIEFKVDVVDSSKAFEIFREYEWTSILEINGRAVVRYGNKLDPTLLELFNENGNINKANGKTFGTISSIAAAAATSAYSRILLNKYVNIPGNLAIYTDTDSVVLRHKLPDKMVGKALGNMKLEHIINKGIFIAPKTYALQTESGKLITKAKGVNIPLKWSDYEALLRGETMRFQQHYWKRDLIKGTVKIIDQSYTLKGKPFKHLDLVVYRYNMAIIKWTGK